MELPSDGTLEVVTLRIDHETEVRGVASLIFLVILLFKN